MLRGATIFSAMLAFASAVSGCETQNVEDVSRFSPSYLGIETRLLDGDLVNFEVQMSGARDRTDVSRYAECAAAQYTLIRGYGFARHLRTKVMEADDTGVWRADAIYTISAGLPDGLKTIDAEVVAADCAENGIPMV